ncbi:MAG: carboxypeptidase regulatory-like domain-containing protein, partial [Planctomycetota bacterium]
MSTLSREGSLPARCRSLSPLRLLILAVAFLNAYRSASNAADEPDTRTWTPAELADGVEAAIARVASSELSTRYIERRNTNAYGQGDAVFASGTGQSVFRSDGTRWYCDNDGFTTRMGKPETSPMRVMSGFDGTVHFEQNRHVVTYGEDNLSVWQHSPGRVFWGAGRDTDFLLGRLRDENAKIVGDETVDDRRQVTVNVDWNWGETAYTYQVTLLPNHSFIPVEATVTINGNLDAEWSASGLKQTDGLWYPAKVARKRFVGKKPDRDKRTIVTAFRLRADFDDSEFRLGSTISLDIVDRRTGTAFHNDPWWNALSPFLRRQLNWPQRDMHSANDYAKYGNDELVGKPAPNLSVAEWINGEPATLTAPDRHLTLLIFLGGRAISPTPRTLAALNNLHRTYHNNGLEVIGVASASDTPNLTRRDVKSLQLSFPVAIDNPNDDPDGNRYGKTFQAYGLKSYYGFFLIDRAGNVLKLRPSKDLLSDIGREPGIGSAHDLRTNVIRILYDAGERELAFGEADLLELNLPQIKVIEPEWKRLLKSSPRTAELTGTITDGNAPIAGATIQATPTLKLLFSFSPGGYFLSVDRDQRFTFKTDDEGHFDAGGLPKGVWQLTIKKPGHASLEKNVTLETSQSAIKLNIENRQKDRIFGRVLDQNGDPVVRATVKVDKRHPDPERPAITTTSHLPREKNVTDQDGRFEITQLYDGLYTLGVEAANFESATTQRVSANGRELIIRLKPIRNPSPQSSTLSPHNSYRNIAAFQSLSPTIRNAGGLAGMANITDEAPEASPLPDRNEPTASLTVTGIVVDEDSQPIANSFVAISPHWPDTFSTESFPPQATLNGTVETRTDERGHFSLRIPDSSQRHRQRITSKWQTILCSCSVWSEGHSVWSKPLELKPEWNWSVDLKTVTLAKGGNLSVSVLKSDARPATDVSVEIMRYALRTPPPEFQKPLTAATDGSGVAEFPGILSRQSLLRIKVTSPDGGKELTKDVRVNSADAVRVTMAFEPTGSVAGQIHSEDPSKLAGLKLRVFTVSPANVGGQLVFIRQGNFFRQRNPPSPVIVTPDSKSRFQVDDLPVGQLFVEPVINDNSDWLLRIPPVTKIVEARQVTAFHADLKPGITLEGFVIDRQSNRPMTDSKLVLKTNDRQINPFATEKTIPIRLDKNGRFRSVVAPGQYRITATTHIPG